MMVRWGLVSTANINRRLIPALRLSDRAELVAVASRNKAKATAYAAEWNIPQVFSSYEAMLTSDAVDAVYMSVPNHLHAQWSIYAMRHGKHVLCEKPFALTLAEVDEVTAVAAETGAIIAEAFMYRHHPQMKLVGDWVHSGKLGEITIVRSVFNFAMGDRRGNVRLVPEWGGGSLWDVGVYPLSFAQYILQDTPEWVLGDQWLGDTGVDETFAGQMHYRSGAVAQITSAFRTPFYTHAEVLGTNGRLSMTRPFTGVDTADSLTTFYPVEGQPEKLPTFDEYLYLGEVEDMHDAILNGQPNYLTLAETRNHIKTALALYESAKTGQIIRL